MTEAEQDRAHELLYSCDSREELCGRVAELEKLTIDMLRWMPCPRPCHHCERYVYPEGCEFEIRRRKLTEKE